MTIDTLINNLTERLEKSPDYKGRNRLNNRVRFYFGKEEVIEITHDEINNNELIKLSKYL